MIAKIGDANASAISSPKVFLQHLAVWSLRTESRWWSMAAASVLSKMGSVERMCTLSQYLFWCGFIPLFAIIVASEGKHVSISGKLRTSQATLPRWGTYSADAKEEESPEGPLSPVQYLWLNTWNMLRVQAIGSMLWSHVCYAGRSWGVARSSWPKLLGSKGSDGVPKTV